MDLDFLDEYPFIQRSFYATWDNSIKKCTKCKINLPNHKLFYSTAKSGELKLECKSCCGLKIINKCTYKMFKDFIPNGLKYCTGCRDLLPADEKHFNKVKDNLYCKCKVCRGWSYGIGHSGINSQLALEDKKMCKYCKNIKDINKFPKVRNTQVTHASYCEECKSLEKEKDRILRKKRVSKKSEYDKYYYQTNREKRLKYRSEWKKTEHGRKVASLLEQKRLAKKKEVFADLTKDQWEESLAYFNYSCAYCGMSESDHIIQHEKHLSQEHVIPLYDDGAYSDFNIIPSCLSCNSKKNKYDLEDFLKRSESFTLERYLNVLDYILLKT